MASLPEGSVVNAIALVKILFWRRSLEWEASRRLVLDERARLDWSEIRANSPDRMHRSDSPAHGTHGSALFTRGETQSLTTATLGTKMDEQIIDHGHVSGLQQVPVAL